MRRVFWLMPLFLLTGCEAQVCALLGAYVGSYQGDAEGELDADVTEDPESKDDVMVNFVLNGADLNGNARVSCTDGELVLDLSDVDGEAAGTVTGLLGAGSGSGDFNLLSGLTGTWNYGK